MTRAWLVRWLEAIERREARLGDDMDYDDWRRLTTALLDATRRGDPLWLAYARNKPRPWRSA